MSDSKATSVEEGSPKEIRKVEGLTPGGDYPVFTLEGVDHSLLPGFVLVSGATWSVKRLEEFDIEAAMLGELASFEIQSPGRRMVLKFANPDTVQTVLYYANKEDSRVLGSKIMQRISETLRRDGELEDGLLEGVNGTPSNDTKEDGAAR